MPSNPTPTLGPPRRIRQELEEVRPPRLAGLLAAGGPLAPLVEDGRR